MLRQSDFFLGKHDEAVRQTFAVLLGASAASQNGKDLRVWTFATDELATKNNVSYLSGTYSNNIYNQITLQSSQLSIYGLSLYSTPEALVNNNTADNAFHGDSAGIGSYIAIDFGQGNEKELTKVGIYSIISGAAGCYVFNVQYSDDGSTWSTAYTGMSYPGGTGWWYATWDRFGAHRHWRLLKTNAATTTVQQAEIAVFTSAGQNFTLAPTAVSVPSSPTQMIPYFLIQPVDSLTLNTDLKVDVSRDGGTNWSGYGDLQLALAYDATYNLCRANFPLSLLPATGTSLLWRLTSYNGKRINVRGAALPWR